MNNEAFTERPAQPTQQSAAEDFDAALARVEKPQTNHFLVVIVGLFCSYHAAVNSMSAPALAAVFVAAVLICGVALGNYGTAPSGVCRVRRASLMRRRISGVSGLR